MHLEVENLWFIGVNARLSEGPGLIPTIAFCFSARHFIHIAALHSALYGDLVGCESEWLCLYNGDWPESSPRS